MVSCNSDPPTPPASSTGLPAKVIAHRLRGNNCILNNARYTDQSLPDRPVVASSRQIAQRIQLTASLSSFSYLNNNIRRSTNCKYRGFICIVDHIFPSKFYFDHYLTGARADQFLLADFICDQLIKNPGAAERKVVEAVASSITLNWFISLFHGAVPTLVSSWWFYPSLPLD